MPKPYKEGNPLPWGDGDPDGEDHSGTFPSPDYGDVTYPSPTRAPDSDMRENASDAR
jgi:hypothetical protein